MRIAYPTGKARSFTVVFHGVGHEVLTLNPRVFPVGTQGLDLRLVDLLSGRRLTDLLRYQPTARKGT